MSKPLHGVLIIGQSGGPTPVINASLAGVIGAAQKHGCFTGIYGLVHGIEGALNEELLDLGKETGADLELLARTPASALGSCRHKLSEDDYERILDVFGAHDVRHFVYIGGNDSMDTCHRISELAAMSSYEMQVMGVPKTIDNDLALTDHCPGYGSAARFLALATRDTGRDLEAMATFDDVTILEAMGRNAGWLTAASVLGKESEDEAPHLVYVPEIPFDEERFLDDVTCVHGRLGRVFVVVSEGIQDADGQFIGQHKLSGGSDAFGHVVHSLTTGVAAYLTDLDFFCHCALLLYKIKISTVLPQSPQRIVTRVVNDFSPITNILNIDEIRDIRRSSHGGGFPSRINISPSDWYVLL